MVQAGWICLLLKSPEPYLTTVQSNGFISSIRVNVTMQWGSTSNLGTFNDHYQTYKNIMLEFHPKDYLYWTFVIVQESQLKILTLTTNPCTLDKWLILRMLSIDTTPLRNQTLTLQKVWTAQTLHCIEWTTKIISIDSTPIRHQKLTPQKRCGQPKHWTVWKWKPRIISIDTTPLWHQNLTPQKGCGQPKHWTVWEWKPRSFTRHCISNKSLCHTCQLRKITSLIQNFV